MSEEELIETLRAFEKNRVEQLEEPARNLFYAIMKIADERDRLNNIINKAKVYCEDVIQEHENGEYNVSTTQLAIEEHKKNIISLLNILNGDLENYWRSE